MGFEEALSALQAFLGKEVAISITPAAAAHHPAYLAEFHGVLTRGTPERVMAPLEGGEALFFSLDGDDDAGLYLSALLFEGADWSGENQDLLVMTMAGVQLSVSAI